MDAQAQDLLVMRAFGLAVAVAPLRDLYIETLVKTLTGEGLRTESIDFNSGERLAFADSADRRKLGHVWCTSCMTMVGSVRLRQIARLLADTDVEGDFAEVGAWRGGVAMLARAVRMAVSSGGAGSGDR